MPVNLSGKTFFRTQEVIKNTGISRSTFFRWIREDKIKDAKYKDHRGWRLFTEEEMARIKKFNETINVNK